MTAGNPPATGLAAVLVHQREPLVIDEVELPRTLAYGQALVRVWFSGICGSQIGEIDGVKGPDPYLPHLLGHEGSGVVEAVGPGVSRVAPGDRVVLHWMQGDGIRAEVPCYRWRHGQLNAGWVTTFNERAVVSENRLTPLPAGVDMDVACLLGCAVTTGLGVIAHNARLSAGESVVVFGAGGVGLNIVQGAALASAHPVIAVDIAGPKLDMARRFGADHVVNSRIENPRRRVPELLDAPGADAVIDTTGLAEVIELAYELTGPAGRTILVGVPRQGASVSLHTLPLHFGKTITGSHGGETQPGRDIPRYARLLAAGKLRVRDMITERCTLDGLNAAIERLRSGQVAGRCIVDLRPNASGGRA